MSNLRTHPTGRTTVTDLSGLGRPTHLRPADHTDQLAAQLQAGDKVRVHLTGHLVQAYRAGQILCLVVDTEQAGRVTVDTTTPTTVEPA